MHRLRCEAMHSVENEADCDGHVVCTSEGMLLEDVFTNISTHNTRKQSDTFNAEVYTEHGYEKYCRGYATVSYR